MSVVRLRVSGSCLKQFDGQPIWRTVDCSARCLGQGKRVLKKVFGGVVVEVPREQEHKLVELTQDPSIFCPRMREGTHFILFSLYQSRGDPQLLQYLTNSEGEPLGQCMCFLGMQYDGQKTAFTDAQHELMRSRIKNVGVPVAQHGCRSRRIVGGPDALQQLLRAADGEHVSCTITCALNGAKKPGF